MKKKKVNRNFTPFTYHHTEKEYKAAAWCIDNGIKIGLSLDESGWFFIDINLNGVIHQSPKSYNAKEAEKKRFEFFKYYYDKNISKRK